MNSILNFIICGVAILGILAVIAVLVAMLFDFKRIDNLEKIWDFQRKMIEQER